MMRRQCWPCLRFLEVVSTMALETLSEDFIFLKGRCWRGSASLQRSAGRVGIIWQLKICSQKNDFIRITLYRAIDILRNSNPIRKRKFQYTDRFWRCWLTVRAERFREKHFKKRSSLTISKESLLSTCVKTRMENGAAMGHLVSQGMGDSGGSQREERLASFTSDGGWIFLRGNCGRILDTKDLEPLHMQVLD